MKCYKKANVYIEGRGIIQTDLTFGKTVLSVGTASGRHVVLPQDAIVLPGFIDEHIHGAGGADVMDGKVSALERIAETVAAEGVTRFLATTMTQDLPALLGALRAVAEYVARGGGGCAVLGVHAEGPFLSEKYAGAQAARYMREPDEELMERLISESGGNVKMVTLAPEKNGAEKLIAYLKARNITVSLGHTAAQFGQVDKAVRAGAACVTHTFNAQSPVHHREIGVAGGALLLDDLATELIADTLHVSAPAVRLLQKCKPRKKLILVTDAMRAKGMGDGVFELGGQTVYVKDGRACLENGVLAGSVLRMNDAVRNLAEITGIPLEEAVDAATINPAENLGLVDRYGSIREGKVADFTVIDKSFKVISTVRDGEEIFRA